MSESRRATIELLYQDKSITLDINKDLLSFSFTDNASGSADDISLTLKDDDAKWINSWAPVKGDIIKPTIATTNWRNIGDTQRLFCGSFMVDEPSYSGRPRVMSLGAISAPVNSDFMTVKKSTTWQSGTLKRIAQSVAKNASLELFFDSKSNPRVDFVEQGEESNSTFLQSLCIKNGLALKLYSQKIVIYSEAEYEAKAAVKTFFETDMLRWSMKTTFTDTAYDGCRISYADPATGMLYNYTFKAPGKTGNKIDKIREPVMDWAEAVRYTKTRLRELNKKEYQINFDLPGDLELFAGQCFNLTEFGRFNGKYFIDKLAHKIGGGFVTSVDAHKCLEGY